MLKKIVYKKVFGKTQGLNLCVFPVYCGCESLKARCIFVRADAESRLR